MELRPSPLQLLLLSAAYLLYCEPVESWPCESEVYCYGDLLDMVQTAGVFDDSKEFVDRPLKASPEDVLAAFEELLNETNATTAVLTSFVRNWTDEAGSDLLPWQPTDWVERPQFVEAISSSQLQQWTLDLNAIWKTLGRKVSMSVGMAPAQHSLLPLSHPFIVPGGRFREAYYWDSYWIVQALLLCEMRDTARGMISNLASLVDTYGLVPNGGRVYYTRRSHPPLLTQMAWLYFNETKDEAFLREILPSLANEHAFWMANRSVSVAGHQLNRYAVDVSSPRPESYIEDIQTHADTEDDLKSQVYSNLASGAESGWDFSSRWLRPPSHALSSIRTRSIVPVELNAILCQNEATLAQLFSIVGNDSEAAKYRSALEQRQDAFDSVFWNEDSGLWLDWNLDQSKPLDGFYASSLVPLLWNCSREPQANTIQRHKLVLKTLKQNGTLNFPGGIPASLVKNSSSSSLSSSAGQQWDFPNAWAPLQWFPVLAWQRSGERELAEAASSIATTWLNTTFTGWQRHNHTMFEKYDCRGVGLPGGGGEYQLQTGFGWTNAVVLHFLSLYPDARLEPQRTASDRRPSLGWVTVVVLLVVSVVVAVPCVFWCKWLYRTGEKRYWGRVKNEHLVAAGGGRSTPTVYTNKYVEHRDSALENREYYEWDT